MKRLNSIRSFTRRLGAGAVALLFALSATSYAQAQAKKPNILVIFGGDVGQTNISAYSFGVMGYKTPNIDRIAKEGMMFTDYYAEQSCTAGRSTFITGQCTLRTGLSKVGLPAATVGLQAEEFRRIDGHLLRPSRTGGEKIQLGADRREAAVRIAIPSVRSEEGAVREDVEAAGCPGSEVRKLKYENET